MAMVVVDASVVIKWFVSEPYSAEARLILNEYEAGQLDLVAPDLLYAELGNIVWKKHLSQGLAAPDAQDIIKTLDSLEFSLTSTGALLSQAYELAVAHRCTVYDSMYLALSVSERCPLVTADERLVNSVKEMHPQVVLVAEWPEMAP